VEVRVLEAKNVVVISLSRQEAQKLLNLIDDLHEQFSKGDHPDFRLLLQLGDALEKGLNLDA